MPAGAGAWDDHSQDVPIGRHLDQPITPPRLRRGRAAPRLSPETPAPTAEPPEQGTASPVGGQRARAQHLATVSVPRSARPRGLAVYETAGNYLQAGATGRRLDRETPYLPNHSRSWPDFVRHGPPLSGASPRRHGRRDRGPERRHRRRSQGTQFAAPLIRSGAPGERHSVRTPFHVGSAQHGGPTAPRGALGQSKDSADDFHA